MDKAEVAAVLEEIATLLELQGENPFRARAYSAAGRTIAQLETNLADIVAAGKLDEIPGIGETLRDKITLLVTTGKLPFYEDLKAKTPPGLLAMLRLPGLGPKKIKHLYDEMGRPPPRPAPSPSKKVSAPRPRRISCKAWRSSTRSAAACASTRRCRLPRR
jgi:DNA polymerase (family 10)